MFLVGDPPTLPLCLDCEDKRQQILERQNDVLVEGRVLFVGCGLGESGELSGT
jgi:hypothetical protein